MYMQLKFKTKSSLQAFTSKLKVHAAASLQAFDLALSEDGSLLITDESYSF